MGVPMTKETISSLTQALQDTLTQSHVEEEEKRRRLSICDSCEHKRRSKCNLCGCFINYKAKLKNSECPLGKWSGLVSETSVDDSGKENAGEEDTH